MTTTRRVRPYRTTGLGHRLAAALILSALLAAAPAPVQAAPLRDGGPSLAGLMSWFEGLLADLSFSWEAPDRPEGSEGPEAAFLPDACHMDPSGGTCSQEATSPMPTARGEEKDLPERPAIK